MSEQVIIVGAGPTGLALASELALAGIPVKILEKRPKSEANITRAFGVHSRTLELLDGRGMAEDVIARGAKMAAAQPNVGVTLEFGSLDSRFNYMMIVPQNGTETVLEKRCLELGVEIVRGAEFVGLRQDADGVDVQVDGRTERAAYVVACDGAHSKVRDVLGMQFVGEQYDVQLLLADVKLDRPPSDFLFATSNENGIQLFVPFGDGYLRSIAWRHGIKETDTPVTEQEIRQALMDIAGDDFGLNEIRWMTRFKSERKQAVHYRVGRVFLAGDAAHVHSPAGAQGMNTGIGDAMNLGWKIAAAIKGDAPSWLLDTYETERHPVGANVLKMTDRLFKISALKSAPARKMAQLLMKTAFLFEAGRRIPRSFLSGLGVSYPPHGEHPHKLAGKRLQDIVLDGTRLAEARRAGKFVLVDTTPASKAAELAQAEYGDRVTTMAGKSTVDIPALILLRPDGYVAWASDDDRPAGPALAEWCGARNA
jgi:2-polyprenyl-6-methoxyphenol hydroxylase-like FAD-dependent oxidoreductase